MADPKLTEAFERLRSLPPLDFAPLFELLRKEVEQMPPDQQARFPRAWKVYDRRYPLTPASERRLRRWLWASPAHKRTDSQSRSMSTDELSKAFEELRNISPTYPLDVINEGIIEAINALPTMKQQERAWRMFSVHSRRFPYTSASRGRLLRWFWK